MGQDTAEGQALRERWGALNRALASGDAAACSALWHPDALDSEANPARGTLSGWWRAQGLEASVRAPLGVQAAEADGDAQVDAFDFEVHGDRAWIAGVERLESGQPAAFAGWLANRDGDWRFVARFLGHRAPSEAVLFVPQPVSHSESQPGSPLPEDAVRRLYDGAGHQGIGVAGSVPSRPKAAGITVRVAGTDGGSQAADRRSDGDHPNTQLLVCNSWVAGNAAWVAAVEGWARTGVGPVDEYGFAIHHLVRAPDGGWRPVECVRLQQLPARELESRSRRVFTAAPGSAALAAEPAAGEATPAAVATQPDAAAMTPAALTAEPGVVAAKPSLTESARGAHAPASVAPARARSGPETTAVRTAEAFASWALHRVQSVRQQSGTVQLALLGAGVAVVLVVGLWLAQPAPATQPGRAAGGAAPAAAQPVPAGSAPETAAQREARRALVASQVTIDGQNASLRHTRIDGGSLLEIFDGNPASLGRFNGGNPASMEITFASPRRIGEVRIVMGAGNWEITLQMSLSASAPPETYTNVTRSVGVDPTIVIPIDKGPAEIGLARISFRNMDLGDEAVIHVRDVQFR